MPIFSDQYGDFSDLDDLATIFDDTDLIVAEGEYDSNQPYPGPHVILTSPNSQHGYDFIKQDDGTYILIVRDANESNQ